MKRKGLIALSLLLCALMLLTACNSGTAPEQTTSADTETVTEKITEAPKTQEVTTQEATTEEPTTEEPTTEEPTTEEPTTEEPTTEEPTTEAPTTEPETETETQPETETETEEVTIVPNDGKPKKFFTLSFDDGITQDLRLIEILKKYDVKCISFNINTGLYGANWTWVGPMIGDPSVTHLRFTEEELKTGIYDGYEVLVHTLTHPSLKNYDKSAARIKKEVGKDATNIEKLTGVRPIGMAWPGGDTEYTDKTIELVLENTDIRFARGTTSTYSFALPEYFMKWMPTCSAIDPNCLTLAQQFIDAECTEDMLFYVWGHAYEFDLNGGQGYETFEQLIKMISEAEDIYLVTNTEFYTIYKDQIPSWKDSE